MLEDLFKQFDSAFADSTIKAYRPDFTHFAYWCVENSISAIEISQQLAQYTEEQLQRLARATTSRHMASISSLI